MNNIFRHFPILKLVLLLSIFELSSSAHASNESKSECEKSVAKIVEYGGIRFEIPPLALTGFTLRPQPTTLDQKTLERVEVRAMDKVWNFNRLLENHEPIGVATVPDKESYSRPGMISVLDMPIKFPGTDYLIPDNFKQLSSSLQEIINFEHSANPKALRNYFAYLTVHQSWVEPNTTQRRPGFHVDGFQGVERPEKEPIEHSYFIFDKVPTVFTSQLFQFSNFDFARYNIFSELDRQAHSQYEYRGTPYEIYMANAYNVHRADLSKDRVFRTFLRLTYSVAIFDRLGLTDNPLFPYQWDRKEKNLQASLQKYSPPVGSEKLPSISSLAAIPGERLGVIGIGEGADGLNAAQTAHLLQSSKEIAFVASFRTERKSMGGSEVLSNMVRVTNDFQMTGRNFETEISKDFPTFVVFDNGTQDLAPSLEWLSKEFKVDGLVFVDGGGNVLSPSDLQKRLMNDHRTMFAGEKIKVPHKTLIIVSPGVEMPPNAHEVLSQVNASRFRPSEKDRALILKNFARYRMPFENPHTFAFIPMIWQQALKGEFGPQQFPTLYPGDPSFIVTPEHQDLMVIPFESFMRVIRP